jgi:DNA topoisomerase IB
MITYSDQTPDKGLRKNLDAAILSDDFRAWGKELPALTAVIKAHVKGEVPELQGLGLELVEMRNRIKTNVKIKKQHLEWLGAFSLWFRKASPEAFRKLDKFSVALKQPWLSEVFAKEVRSQTPHISELKKLTKTLVGQGKVALDEDESQAAKAKNPEVYKAYVHERKLYNQVWKDALATYVRTSGKHTVPMKAAEDFLKKQGLTHSMAGGFTGRVDADGRWYTDDEEMINGVPSSNVFPTVVMNKQFGKTEDNWYFYGVRKDGKKGNYYYTVGFKKAQTKKKFEAVGKMLHTVDKARAKWVNLIRKFDESQPDTVAALIIEVVFQVAGRIGKANNKNGTFGVSTLLVKHTHWQKDGSVRFIYPGKSGVKTIHWLKPNTVLNRLVLKHIASLYEGKSAGEPLFTYTLKNGMRKPVLPAVVNRVFASCGLTEVTVHKIRTYHGTKLFKEEMEKLFKLKPTFNNPKVALKTFNAIALKVGKMLNHVRNTSEGAITTPNTALQNYIDPMVQLQYFEFYSLPLTAMLDKLVNASTIRAIAANMQPEDQKLVQNLTPDQFTPGIVQVLKKVLENVPEHKPEEQQTSPATPHEETSPEEQLVPPGPPVSEQTGEQQPPQEGQSPQGQQPPAEAESAEDEPAEEEEPSKEELQIRQEERERETQKTHQFRSPEESEDEELLEDEESSEEPAEDENLLDEEEAEGTEEEVQDEYEGDGGNEGNPPNGNPNREQAEEPVADEEPASEETEEEPEVPDEEDPEMAPSGITEEEKQIVNLLYRTFFLGGTPRNTFYDDHDGQFGSDRADNTLMGV